MDEQRTVPAGAEGQSEAGNEGNLAGAVLEGRYEIVRSLDRGGMATVYLANDRQLQRPVVVKIPHAVLMVDRTFRTRFLQEIRDLAAHEHPGILRIESWGEHEDTPYAVTQYLGGGNLRDRIHASGGQQSQQEIMQWLPRVAEALDFIHARGSLHRDVKPANILFDELGNPVLSDFGIATAMGAADPNAPTEEVSRDLTLAGTFIGSPAYAPPEAIDRVLTPAYDQYSLATVVFLALAGELPFVGGTNEAILISKAKDDPPPLDRKRIKGPLSKGSEKAIRRALARAPEDRFASCVEFAEAFATARATSESSERRFAGTPARGLLAVGLTVLIGIALLAFWLLRPGSDEADTRLPEPEAIVDQTRVDETRVPVAAAEPIRATLGSRPTEIDEAVALCEVSGGDARECARERFADEQLREVVFATPFELDRHETTNAEFERFVEETGYRTTAEISGQSIDITPCRGCSWRKIFVRPERLAADHPADPVVHVSWNDAKTYCEWRGARLPSEDEWEFTARGQERRKFPWGDEWSVTRLRRTDRKGIGLEPIGSHPTGATPEGIEELAGSVSEWTSTSANGNRERVFKGGSWMDRIPTYFRSAAFSTASPDYSSSSLGFRCARDETAG